MCEPVDLEMSVPEKLGDKVLRTSASVKAVKAEVACWDDTRRDISKSRLARGRIWDGVGSMGSNLRVGAWPSRTVKLCGFICIVLLVLVGVVI